MATFPQVQFNHFDDDDAVGGGGGDDSLNDQVNRHHWNALKYFVSMTVVISSNLPASDFKTWFWAICAIAATAFSSYWDIKFDFGLGDKNYGYLRKNLSIRPRILGTNVYYVVVVTNVLLRCSWVLSIASPEQLGITLNTELLKVCSCRLSPFRGFFVSFLSPFYCSLVSGLFCFGCQGLFCCSLTDFQFILAAVEIVRRW